MKASDGIISSAEYGTTFQFESRSKFATKQKLNSRTQSVLPGLFRDSQTSLNNVMLMFDDSF